MSDAAWATGDTRTSPLSSKPMKPRHGHPGRCNRSDGPGSILSIEALLVARVPPRLAVACAQMLFARDARDAARALDPHHVRLERPLPAPRKDDGLALGLLVIPA